jgi:hypothetical protein
MMPNAFGVEARGTSFDGHFAHQASLHQIPQIVIGRGPRRTWVQAIDRLENLCSSGMSSVLHQERHDAMALRSTPQPAALKALSNRF